jgi:endonuclease/exonuclease/phosphatase family metal-dependent hydrolase
VTVAARLAAELPAGGQPDLRPLRVVTWNIRAAIGPGEPFPAAWWRHVRRERLEHIAEVLRALEPDVVTLQEVAVMNAEGEIHDQAADLGRLIGLHAGYGAVHAYPLIQPETGRSIGSASWGNAILSREPLRDAFTIGLPRARDDDLVEPVGADHELAGVRYEEAAPGHREARCAVGGRLAVGETEIGVVTCHLTYIGRRQRLEQVAALAGVAGRLGEQVVVTGDFNAPLDADELEPIRASFDDAFGACGVAIDDPDRHTWHASSIDHVVTRGLRAIACRVVTEAGDASDHLPVVADLVP